MCLPVNQITRSLPQPQTTMKPPTSRVYLLVFLIQVACCSNALQATTASTSVANLAFLGDTFTGYISENVIASPMPTTVNNNNNNNITASRHNRNLAPPNQRTTPLVYVRFVGKLKPSLAFDKQRSTCHSSSYSTSDLMLELHSHDYDAQAVRLFELDPSLDCVDSDDHLKCHCYVKLRLRQGESLNREAKDTYHMTLKTTDSAAVVRVNVLDDNDLEPMFDQSEYEWTVLESESEYLPPFAVLGRVSAADPDLEANAQVRYYAASSSPSVCMRLFGVNWRSGDVFMKLSSEQLFRFTQHGLFGEECLLEVNAIDTGLKVGLVKSLLKQINEATPSLVSDE